MSAKEPTRVCVCLQVGDREREQLDPYETAAPGKCSHCWLAHEYNISSLAPWVQHTVWPIIEKVHVSINAYIKKSTDVVTSFVLTKFWFNF